MSASKPRVVIDTQVFLRAALNRRSLPAKLIFDWRDRYELVSSSELIAEVNRPSLRAKFTALTDEVIESVVNIFNEAMSVELTKIPAISRDRKDDMFIACAKLSEAGYIVSEDNDLLVLNPLEGINIINVQAFEQLLTIQN